MRNIELKARLADLNAARRIAESVATKRLGPQHQVDTYFHPASRALLEHLMRQFALSPADLLPGSYGEMAP